MSKPLMCDPELLRLDLSGRIYVVTGANSGIGLVVAKQLAQQGATVVMACRRIADAQRCITEAGSLRGELVAMRLDLGDLASVRAFASEFCAQHTKLDGLINNAGVMNTPKGETKDGFELQIGINHLGHFLLTELLLDLLKKSAPSRIVNVSSCYHDKAMGREGEVDLADLHFKRRRYDGWKAYAQSKLANVLHAKKLAEVLQGSGVTAVSVHPGWVRTRLARNTLPLWVQNVVLRPALHLMGMIEPWEGAQTTLYAVLEASVETHSGEFFSQLGIYRDKSANSGGWPLRSPNPHAHDGALADALHEKSRELVGLHRPQHEAPAAG